MRVSILTKDFPVWATFRWKINITGNHGGGKDPEKRLTGLAGFKQQPFALGNSRSRIADWIVLINHPPEATPAIWNRIHKVLCKVGMMHLAHTDFELEFTIAYSCHHFATKIIIKKGLKTSAHSCKRLCTSCRDWPEARMWEPPFWTFPIIIFQIIARFYALALSSTLSLSLSLLLSLSLSLSSILSRSLLASTILQPENVTHVDTSFRNIHLHEKAFQESVSSMLDYGCVCHPDN